MGFAAAPQEQPLAEDVEMKPEGALPEEVEAKVMETMQAYVLLMIRWTTC